VAWENQLQTSFIFSGNVKEQLASTQVSLNIPIIKPPELSLVKGL
jgi:hypothetical protein